MSDHFWPKGSVSIRQLDEIEQIVYSAHPSEDGVLFWEVHYINNRDDIAKEFWSSISAFCGRHFQRFFWRHYVLVNLWVRYRRSKSKKLVTKEFITFLEKMIVLMDDVVEAFLKPCRKLSEDIPPDWRCRDFDEYLATEFYARRHDPGSVNRFRDASDVQLEKCHVAKWNKCRKSGRRH